jgi:hypothetical protein
MHWLSTSALFSDIYVVGVVGAGIIWCCGRQCGIRGQCQRVRRHGAKVMSAGLVNALNELKGHLLRECKWQEARHEGYQWALYDIRNSLLIAALRIMAEWQNQLARDGERVRSTTHLKFAAQLQGLNNAFDELSKIEPRITTRLDIEQLCESALQSSKFGCHSKSIIAWKPSGRTGVPRQHPEVDEAEFEAGYRYMRESLDQRLFSLRSRIPIVLDSEETAIL